MANTTKLTIVIDADGTAAVKVFEKGEKQVKSFAANVKKNWLAMSAAAAAAGVVIKKAIDFAKLSDQYDQNRRSFNSMVTAMGRDAEVEFAKIREASGNLIDKNALTEAANRALSLGIPIERLGELMEVSRAKARDMGITSTQAFNDIATGIGRGSIMILDNLGLTIKIGQANAVYAASIGKVVEQLTDFEKKQALITSVIDAGTEAIERQDLTIRTNAERWQAWDAQITNIKITIGDFIQRVALGLVAVFQLVSSAILMVSAGLANLPAIVRQAFTMLSSFFLGVAADLVRLGSKFMELKDAMGITEGAAEAWRAEADNLMAASIELQDEVGRSAEEVTKNSAAYQAAKQVYKEATDNLKLMTASTRELDAAQVALRKNAQPETVAEDENLEKRLEIIRDMENRVALIGLEADEQALLQMDQKHAQEIAKLDELGLLKAERANAEILQEQERQGLITEIKDQARQADLDATARAEAAKNAMRASAIGNFTALLNVFGQKSKAAAIAAIALQKGQMIATTIASGKAAELRAMAEVPYPANIALAGKIAFWTAANVAAIGALGLAQAAGGGGGGISGGGGGGGGATGAAAAAPPPIPDTAVAAEPKIIVQVFNQGSVVTHQELARDVHDQLEILREDGLPSDTRR